MWFIFIAYLNESSSLVFIFDKVTGSVLHTCYSPYCF